MFRIQKLARPIIAPIAGQRVSSRLINAVQSHWVQLDLSGILNVVTNPAAAILNRGSLWAAIDEVHVQENGRDVAVINGRVLRALSEQAAPSSLSSVRASALAVAAYPLKESVRIYFAHPFALQPRETAFMEHDPRQVLEVGVRLAASGGADKLATAGAGGTVTLTALNVNVTHGYDAGETIKPYFIPHIRQQIDAVPGTNAALPIFLKTPYVIRSIVVSPEDTVLGEVSDIVNSLKLRGDAIEWIADVSWENLIAGSEFEFGGASTFNVGDAHLGLNFQTFGRLAKCLNPNQDTNLRFELNCQKSLVGTGTSQIRTTIIELWTDAQLTQPLTIPV